MGDCLEGEDEEEEEDEDGEEEEDEDEEDEDEEEEEEEEAVAEEEDVEEEEGVEEEEELGVWGSPYGTPSSWPAQRLRTRWYRNAQSQSAPLGTFLSSRPRKSGRTCLCPGVHSGVNQAGRP